MMHICPLMSIHDTLAALILATLSGRGPRMRMLKGIAIVLAGLVTCGAVAQQVTGTLGSPSATSTVSNAQLPTPDPKFGGVIKNDTLSSKP